MFGLKAIGVDRNPAGNDNKLILKHLSDLIRMMRCISNVTRLELDFRDYEFVNVEVNARKDGLISSLGIKHPIWTCHRLKIRTATAVDDDGNTLAQVGLYDTPTEKSFSDVMRESEGVDNDINFDKLHFTNAYIKKMPLYIPCVDLVIQIGSGTNLRPCSTWLESFFSRLSGEKIESLTLQRSDLFSNAYYTLENGDLKVVCQWIEKATSLKRLVVRNMNF